MPAGPSGIVLALSGTAAHRALAGLARSFQAVPLMAFSVGFTRFVVSSHPDTAREILNSSAFADRPIKESAYELLFHRAMGFAPFGEYWRNLRRISATYLFSPRRIAAFGEHRRLIGEQMVGEVKELMGRYGEVEVKRILHFGSLNNVMMSVFGKSFDFGEGEGEGVELEGMMGRCKISLKKIEGKHERQITFSKRRTGLFSKASDLARAGCEVAVIISSAVDNVFTFGHPSVEAVAGRFLGQEDINLAPGPGLESEGREDLAGPSTGGEAPPREEEDETIVEDEESESEEDKEEEGSGGMNGGEHDGDEEKMADDHVATKGESLAEEPLDSRRFWWNDRIDDLDLEKLVEFESSLMEMQHRVLDRANKLLIEKPTMGFPFNFNNSKFKFRLED